jgi:hypothetical protein
VSPSRVAKAAVAMGVGVTRSSHDLSSHGVGVGGGPAPTARRTASFMTSSLDDGKNPSVFKFLRAGSKCPKVEVGASGTASAAGPSDRDRDRSRAVSRSVRPTRGQSLPPPSLLAPQLSVRARLRTTTWSPIVHSDLWFLVCASLGRG